MRNPIQRIRQSLTLKLTIGILAFVVALFVVSLGFLFQQSRKMLREEAMDYAERVLDNTALRVRNCLDEVEVATQHAEWQVYAHLQPDSLLAFTHRVVALNPDINGCSITTEPYFFTQFGRYFSAYSIRQNDSVKTVREGEYEYFDKVWYSTPRVKGKAVWVDPFDDYNEGTLSAEEMIVSYCKPLYNERRQLIGVLSTDLSLPKLSRTITAEKPFPNSYTMLLGHRGHYFVHPDTTKLIHTTILDGIDPKEHSDIVELALQMMEGKTGHVYANIEGQRSIVFYQPLEGTDWSIALVCMESDILGAYHQLVYIVIPLLAVGLLIILVFCCQTIKHFIQPVNELVEQTRHIADGHYDEQMPHSSRKDEIGNLQNSFIHMQQSINQHVSRLQSVNKEVEQCNLELSKANAMVAEAEQKKTEFIQDVLHQVRTPLNIIQGFVQVLHDGYGVIPADETNRILETMQHNAISVTRMVNMLVTASAFNGYTVVECNDYVRCNKIAHEAAVVYHQRPPETVDLHVETEVPDSLRIHTNKSYLMKTLNELLYNAKKFTNEGVVVLRVKATDEKVQFVVEDTGSGIAEADRERIFTQFFKHDGFTEGLGLGLPVCKQHARQLGGDLIYDDTYEHGSRFILELPKS